MKEVNNKKQHLLEKIKTQISDKTLLDEVEKELNAKSSATPENNGKAGVENKFRLSTLMDNLPGMAYRCKNDKDWTMLYVSSGCYQLTGYHPEELINNRLVSFNEIVHPLYRERVFNEIRSAVKNGQTFKTEYQICDKNGNERWVWEQGQIVEQNADGSSFIEGFIMDITERKKAEERLLENEKQLKKAQAIGKIGSWKFDFNTNLVSASEESIRIYGVDTGKKISIQEIQKIALPEYREMLDNALEDLVNSGASYNIKFKIKRPADGQIIDIHSVAEFNPEDNTVTGIIRDISESKKAGKLLRDSEELYRSLINNSSDAIYILYNRRFEIVNTAFDKLLEYNLGELRTLNIDPIQFIAPESIPFIQERIKKLENGEDVDTLYEFTAITKTGKKIEVEASVAYIPFKNGTATQGIIRDITERKASEKKIKALSEFRNLLVELSANFIHVPLEEIDSSVNKSLARLGRFVNADRAYVFEYNFEERYYKNTFEWCDEGISPQIDNLQFVPLDWSMDLIEKHRRGEIVNIPDVAEIEQAEMRRFLEDQEIKSLLTLPLFSDGECSGFVGFDAVKNYFHFSDDEIEILQIYAKILVNSFERQQREKELILAKERAEESDLLKSAFLANMSHEIRTPMNGILGFTNLLKQTKLSGEEKEEFIDIIQQSGERMLNTIDDIISISKIESGTLDVKWSSYDIARQLSYFYRFFKPEADKKGLQLNISEDSTNEKIEIKADKEKLNAVLSNLIKNAIKYTNSGFIEIGFRCKKDKTEFFVKDTGIGINKEQLNAVFDRFVQEDYSSSKPYEGVGLGLSISKGYIEMMGGKIWVESEKGEGSIFRFSLPLINPESATTE